MTKADTKKKAVAAIVVSALLQLRSSDIGLSTIPKANLSPLEKNKIMKATARVNQAFLIAKEPLP
jgi:hypothetical protein|tara:strand:- start:8875 stop:9069 length:195 start_codon:yes stop_codon:yes gene_type:complete